jgi:hypothetical protein
MLLNTKSAKEAWEAIKSMRLGAERVKEVNAQKLLVECRCACGADQQTGDRSKRIG